MPDYFQILRLAYDTLLMFLFFAPIIPEGKPPRLHRVLAFAAVVALVPIYLISTISSVGMLVVRFVVRTLVYAAFLHGYKGIGPARSLYFGTLCWIAFTCENNTFLTPQLSVLRWHQLAFTGNPLADAFLCNAAEWLLELGIVLLFRAALPLEKIYRIDRGRWISAGAVVLCELYIKYTLKLFSVTPQTPYPTALTVYPILLQILIVLFLVFFERYLHGRIQEEHARMSALTTRYLYENARTTVQADAELRRLNHDLKNHLLVLQRLTGNNPEAQNYIRNLVADMSEASVLVETGSSILNGLISEKMRRARQEQIDLNANVDFRAGSFIADSDACAIFGNALDNALEACARIPDPDKRSVLLKCTTAAQNLIITCTNYCQEPPTPRGHLFASQKQQSGHGIGLSSILHSARKYGGTMTAGTDADHNFVLTVLIPLP